MLDILIRGGTVIDGTGRPARPADVAIAGDRIEAIEPLPNASATRVIDAAGHVVTPGFVDMHSHADFVLPGLPTADSKVHQGFTVEVVGNCGASPAPLTPGPAPGRHRHLRPHLAGARLGLDDLPELPRRPDPSGALDQRRPLVGHGTVRLLVMGPGDARPTADQLRAMTTEVRRAMEDGAVGLSTGLIYAPGVFTDTDELVELARAPRLWSSRLRSPTA